MTHPFVLCIAGTADAADVTRQLSNGHVARTSQGRVHVRYQTGEMAIADVSAYLRPRAMTFVKFGLDDDVDRAQRLADNAGRRELWVSEKAAAGVDPAVLEAVALGYRIRL